MMVVAPRAMTIAAIIGHFRRTDVRKAAETPTSPAIHSDEKSVRARGKIRAPSEATGRSIMHFRMKRGRRERNDEAKYGIILGSSVTAEHVSISTSLFNSGLLVCIDDSSEERRSNQ